MISLVLFLVGFFILVKGAGILVNGSVAISEVLGLSPWIVGVLVVGIGTSIPELSISIVSALKGTDIGISTILGGNIFNILFILGISAVISPAVIRKDWVVKDFSINVISALVAAFFLMLPVFGDRTYFGITSEEAFVILSLFIIWVFYMILRRPTYSIEKKDDVSFNMLASLGMVGGGFLGVYFGADWVVGGAEKLALILEIPAHIVGLSVLAIGTSLPEVAVSVAASFKGRTDIAVGNIIGSNIFDFFGIVGVTGIITAIPFGRGLIFDVVMMLLATVSLILAMFMKKKYTLSRSAGLVFILIYFVYFVTILIRAPL